MENLTKTSKVVEKCETKMDIPGSLPIEIFHEVLLYLSSQDLYNAWKCCRKWKNHMESFWKKKCRIEHYFECEDDLNSKFYRNFMERFSYWEGIYMYNSRLRENWINLNYKEIVVHHNFNNLPSWGVNPIVYYISDDVIIATTGAIQKELLVINCTTGVVEYRIFPPFDQTSGIVRIFAVEIIENQLIVVWKHINYLIEGYNLRFSGTIYFTVWNIKTAELLIKSKKEMLKALRKVIIYRDLVTVITDSHGAYIFNIKTGNLNYEQCNITSACHYNDKIILGNHEGTIVMMDLEYTKLMTLKCCTDDRSIVNIVMEKNYLVCRCQSRTALDHLNHHRACIWNIETKTKLYELQNVGSGMTLFVNENKLCYSTLPGNSNSPMFKLCHLDTGECLFELNKLHYHVFTNNFLIIQRDKKDQRSLKMWSIKTGELVADLDTISPYTDKFFDFRYIGTKKTKTKIAHFKFDLSSSEPLEATLNIIDFQAQLKV